ncbi:MAG: hypothetical protein GTO18_16345 [Anaerolineales bacterium]|nr:hypothetical protein [Anaerolineales bacterium]
MANLLVLFLDGIGLGSDEPDRNPLSAASMPALRSLLGSRSLVAGSSPFHGDSASLLALDTQLGIEGMPQSATGQAVLLTGRNVPAEIGQHYGPKPNPDVAAILSEHNLFMEVQRRGGTAALLNAYPPRYFKVIESKLRLYSAIPMAANAAGIPLMTAEDLQKGRAISPDFTGDGWAAQPDFPPAPVYTPVEAGALLAKLSREYDLAWFDYWLSDYAGHRGSREQAIELLETFDRVISGLNAHRETSKTLIVITSDHGNLEDLEAKGHTHNPVPLVLIGPRELRDRFCEDLNDLTSFYESALRVIF